MRDDACFPARPERRALSLDIALGLDRNRFDGDSGDSGGDFPGEPDRGDPEDPRSAMAGSMGNH